MADVNLVTDRNLGPAFNLDLLAQLIGINFSTEVIYQEQYAGGDNGVGASALWNRGCAVSSIAGGQYRVVFDSPHPDGDEYAVTFSGSEDNFNRDNPKVTLIQGSKSAAGFQLMVTVDDNGTIADPYANNGWAFSVCAPKTVVVSIP